MASPKLRRRAWTLYLFMAFVAIALGVLMFLFAGGWWRSPSSQLIPPAGLHAPRPVAMAPHV
ncbi:MAG TPA: hypothetical protein VG871_07040 [Vicinamibacterales bacterium]|nr:hypothetical protein [Vicinamibacterales bacterium]